MTNQHDAHPAPASGGLLPLDPVRLKAALDAFRAIADCTYPDDAIMNALSAWEATRPAPPAQPAGVSAWIPCSERLPDVVGTYCLIPNYPYVAKFMQNKHGGGFYSRDDYNDDWSRERPTHWQPLPPPPAAIAASKGTTP